MSYCLEQSNGKDRVTFVTKEDEEKVPVLELRPLEPDEEIVEPQGGLIKPNGDINWSCPCLGGMATGPCALEFREAFSCFHHSEDKSECIDKFKTMNDCFEKYPTVYGEMTDLPSEENPAPDA